MKTFRELERIAYIEGRVNEAKLYAELADTEMAKEDVEDAEDKITELEQQIDELQSMIDEARNCLTY